MNSSDIYNHVVCLENCINSLESEIRRTKEALRVAHDTIQQKQGRIEALEARPDMSEDVKQALASMEHLVERYEAFYDRLMDEDRKMVDRFRAVWPKRKEGAA